MFKEGVININKPADWTSQDVCAKLRGRLHIKRIGHTGTLDPMATGVLPVCIGRSTRIIEYYEHDLKSYRAEFKLGVETDTLDITGEITKTQDFSFVTIPMVEDAVSKFVGEIEQIPPKYSALKINGKKAYELAREGKDFDIKPRKIRIHSIDIINIDILSGVVEIDVTCSKGTYIRTLCDDIGHLLGCGATMTSLIRTANGCFKLENSVNLLDLIEMTDEQINEIIQNPEDSLSDLGSIQVKDDNFKAYVNGNTIDSKGFDILVDTNFDNLYKVFINGKFQGIGAIENDTLRPKKVISFDNN